ncbi:protein PHYTOCHROME KINASE SUBSTRATE 4-like [Trifolium medium]|uniref:Protein PHYTOCHROME KINASE SUBSTRATE 4-like n=1 Tax=Trifolium medium TaxID=97028 RepID=A0A392R3M1_9FABA|nr:protein PHYTOCHROME KINASE SUBSTRATE 4-like [Trifolium medium]
MLPHTGDSRDSFDEGSVMTAMMECYEPSEASIEWCVTTDNGNEKVAPSADSAVA